MKYWKKDILILLGIFLIWILISLVLQNKVCASWKTCSPIPTNEIVQSHSPSINISSTCTPTPSMQSTETSIPSIPTVLPNTGIPATGILNTPIPATATPNAGQSATIAIPTKAPDTGRAE